MALKVVLRSALGARFLLSVTGNLASPADLTKEMVLPRLRVGQSASTPGTANLLITLVLMICTVEARPECLPANSIYKALTAPQRETDLNSLYMFTVSVRVKYLKKIPKFLMQVAFLLEDLAGGDDFTLDLADLVLTLHEVPKLGPCENLVTSEDTHSVALGLGVLLSWQSSSDNVKLSNLHTIIALINTFPCRNRYLPSCRSQILRLLWPFLII